MILTSFRANAGANGISLTYSRGSQSVEDLVGLIGVKQYEITNANGLKTIYDSHDVLIAREDLKFGDNFVTPKRGDKITYTHPVTESTITLIVQFPDEKTPVFRDSDHQGYILRIHTIAN